MGWFKRRSIQGTIDRRAGVRMACERDLTCQELTQTSEGQFFGKIVDISWTGLSLILNCHFERDTILVIDLENTAPFLVRVARCQPQGSDWLIGCSLVRAFDDDDLKAIVAPGGC